MGEKHKVALTQHWQSLHMLLSDLCLSAGHPADLRNQTESQGIHSCQCSLPFLDAVLQVVVHALHLRQTLFSSPACISFYHACHVQGTRAADHKPQGRQPSKAYRAAQPQASPHTTHSPVEPTPATTATLAAATAVALPESSGTTSTRKRGRPTKAAKAAAEQAAAEQAAAEQAAAEQAAAEQAAAEQAAPEQAAPEQAAPEQAAAAAPATTAEQSSAAWPRTEATYGGAMAAAQAHGGKVPKAGDAAPKATGTKATGAGARKQRAAAPSEQPASDSAMPEATQAQMPGTSQVTLPHLAVWAC